LPGTRCSDSFRRFQWVLCTSNLLRLYHFFLREDDRAGHAYLLAGCRVYPSSSLLTALSLRSPRPPVFFQFSIHSVHGLGWTDALLRWITRMSLRASFTSPYVLKRKYYDLSGWAQPSSVSFVPPCKDLLEFT